MGMCMEAERKPHHMRGKMLRKVVYKYRCMCHDSRKDNMEVGSIQEASRKQKKGKKKKTEEIKIKNFVGKYHRRT